jgi:hypothetical protein
LGGLTGHDGNNAEIRLVNVTAGRMKLATVFEHKSAPKALAGSIGLGSIGGSLFAIPQFCEGSGLTID